MTTRPWDGANRRAKALADSLDANLSTILGRINAGETPAAVVADYVPDECSRDPIVQAVVDMALGDEL